MVENGRRRAVDYDFAAVTGLWRELLFARLPGSPPIRRAPGAAACLGVSGDWAAAGPVGLGAAAALKRRGAARASLTAREAVC